MERSKGKDKVSGYDKAAKEFNENMRELDIILPVLDQNEIDFPKQRRIYDNLVLRKNRLKAAMERKFKSAVDPHLIAIKQEFDFVSAAIVKWDARFKELSSTHAALEDEKEELEIATDQASKKIAS